MFFSYVDQWGRTVTTQKTKIDKLVQIVIEGELKIFLVVQGEGSWYEITQAEYDAIVAP